jgi:hypothetical protein
MYAQRKQKNSKFEKVPSKHAEHARKELMQALSMWSGTDACTERRQALIMRIGN